MSKTLIVLPDGTELGSGPGTENSICSVTVTQCVNSAQALMPGSVCAAALDATVFTRGGLPGLCAGAEVAVYRVEASGRRRALGLFTLEEPQWPSPHRCRLTAYDRIARLDRDLSGWLAGLTGWPYGLLDFAKRVCAACGLTLGGTELLNGSFPVRKFAASAVTGRQLLQWVGQLSGCFCRATAAGEVEFSWYRRNLTQVLTPGSFAQTGTGVIAAYSGGSLTLSPAGVTDPGNGNVTAEHLAVLSDDGNGSVTLAVDDGTRQGHPCFSGTLRYEAQAVAPIDRVHLRLTQEDVGVMYPDTGENPYTVTGNYLLSGGTEGELLEVAQVLYRRLRGFTYTPCRVSIQACSGIEAGDVLQVTDREGKTFFTCVQTLTRTGQRLTLESTAAPDRTGTEAVNAESFKALSGRLLEVRKSVDGLTLRAAETEQTGAERYAQLSLRADGLDTRVSGLAATGQNRYTRLTLRADGLDTKVSALEQTTDTHYSELTQRADSLTVRVGALGTQGENLNKDLSGLEQQLQTKATVEQVTQVKTAADGLSVTVSRLRTDTDAKADRTQVRALEEHFAFGTDGMTIYNTASGMGIGVSEERVEFTGGAEASTVIRPNDMQTTNLRVGTRLDLGDFSFFPRTNGNLSFRYTGSG